MLSDDLSEYLLVNVSSETTQSGGGDTALTANVHDAEDGDAANTTGYGVHDETAETMREKYDVVYWSNLQGKPLSTQYILLSFYY